MNKRLKSEYDEFVYKGEKTPFSPGTLAVVIFCTVLLIAATFTKIDISHYWPVCFDGQWQLVVKKFALVPQIPVVLMAAALLGARYGSLVIVFYLLCGFFVWPVFGFGGGLEYIKSYFFGYLLGFFAAVIFAGRILSHKYGVINMICASAIGVLSIHICGNLYSSILSSFGFPSFGLGFMGVLVQIGYDVLFSIAAVAIAKPLKYILWIGMKNERNIRPVKRA